MGGGHKGHAKPRSGLSQKFTDITGLKPSPELLAIGMVYFVQGILGLARLALSFFFKDDLGVEPAQVAVLLSSTYLPWMIKPVYGFITDSIPLFGYRRRTYLVLCGMLGAGSWTLLATCVDHPSTAVGAMLMASLGTAFADVVVDSIVVERARGEPQATAGSLQSLCWASSAFGGIISAYFSGSLVETYGVRFVFGVTALFPLITSASAMLIDEKPVVQHDSRKRLGETYMRQEFEVEELIPASSVGSVGEPLSIGQRLSNQVTALWATVKQPNIFMPVIFVLVWQASPSSDAAMFFFQTNELGFKPEFLGRVRLAGSLASLAGVALYNTYLKKVPLRKMLMWCMILGVLLGSTTLILVSGLNRKLGMSDELFVLGDSVMLTVLGQVSFMPILVLAARLCPEGVEATLFATLMSVLNFGGFIGNNFGAALTAGLGVTSTNFDNLFLLVSICTILQLLPAPFLQLLPHEIADEDPSKTADSDDDDQRTIDVEATPLLLESSVHRKEVRAGVKNEAD